MLRVGLTGGIGSGKSTVADRLVSLGAVLVDADKIAREVVEPGTPGHAAVVREFGRGVLTDDGSLDRAALGKEVFADEARRQALNRIVHPLVSERRNELLAQASADAVVVEDIPLLVENGLGAGFHLVVVVYAPVEERVRRLVGGRGMAAEDVRARVRSQASDEERRAAADVWLDNSGPPGDLLAAVDALWADRLVPFEANLRTRTPAERSGSAVLVPYDDTWPVQAARLAARISAAAGEHGLRTDHVGSTAIPGMRAKDVIDLQLSVASLDDADRIRTTLEDAGYPYWPGIDADRPKPADPDPAHWRKRVHTSADPGRAV
ncbi:MAG: dephospho-CoA kinase, partial [Actinomycetota bacterium]